MSYSTVKTSSFEFPPHGKKLEATRTPKFPFFHFKLDSALSQFQ